MENIRPLKAGYYCTMYEREIKKFKIGTIITGPCVSWFCSKDCRWGHATFDGGNGEAHIEIVKLLLAKGADVTARRTYMGWQLCITQLSMLMIQSLSIYSSRLSRIVNRKRTDSRPSRVSSEFIWRDTVRRQLNFEQFHVGCLKIWIGETLNFSFDKSKVTYICNIWGQYFNRY